MHSSVIAKDTPLSFTAGLVEQYESWLGYHYMVGKIPLPLVEIGVGYLIKMAERISTFLLCSAGSALCPHGVRFKMYERIK